ncbi:MAG: hypothetical protein KC996_11990 [Phycisphaerales bacterium]|nr:hypothetical protein [Phycisphaerales bacterium]
MKLATKSMLFVIAGAASASLAGITTVDFEDGLTHGWEGPQGFGGASFIDATHGVDGGAGYRTQFNNFGIDFANNTNTAFLGDYTQYDSVTISVDVKVDQIGTFLPVSRPFVLELRSFDLAQNGYPWTSVWFEFAWISQSANSEFTTFSATIINPLSTDLPAGWGGFGAEDPNTFEPILPDGVTFADVLADVDEIAFTTIEPGFFFSFDDYDVTLDNISITTTPAPSAMALLAIGGMVGTRRRR